MMKKCPNLILFMLACAATAAAQTSQTAGPPSSTSSTAAAADAPAGVTVVKFNWERIRRPADWDAPAASAPSQTVENPRSGGIPEEPNRNRVPRALGGSAPMTTRTRTTATTGESVATSGGRDRPSNTPPPTPGQRGAADYFYQLRLTNGGERRIESVDWEYLFLEPGTQKEVGRHHFLSPRRAKPGETFTLKVGSLSPPARVVSAVALDKKRKPFDERVVVRCVAYDDGTFARREGAAETDCDSLREASERARRRRQQ